MSSSSAIELDWNCAVELIKTFDEFYQIKKRGETIELDVAADKVAAAFGITDIDAFLRDSIQGGFNGTFDDQDAKEMAGIVAGMCRPLAKLIMACAKGEMTPASLYEGINGVYLGNVEALTNILQQGLGFTLSDGIVELLQEYSLDAVSIYCFAAAFKIYRNAADDAQLAREHRIEIERLCGESIEKLKRRRTEMEELFSTYMLDRLEPFSAGVVAMDRAIIENDDDGYIAANAELWKMLGREAQYHNAGEFDDLMLSDENFKL